MCAGYAVPKWMSQRLKGKAAIRKWLIEGLGALDLNYGLPAVKQLCKNPQDERLFGFDMPEEDTDAVILVGDQAIHVHKWVLGMACEVLATKWGPDWADTDAPIHLNVFVEGPGLHVSYNTAYAFFGFLYDGAVNWPQEQPDANSFMELLVLADEYQVPYLMCEAEIIQAPPHPCWRSGLLHKSLSSGLLCRCSPLLAGVCFCILLTQAPRLCPACCWLCCCAWHSLGGHKPEVSKEKCATHVRALDLAAARLAALEADNVQLQMGTAQVGCAPSL